MDNFDDLLGRAKNFVDAAGRKTSEAVEIAKLKMTRMQVNAEIQKTYEKLGAFVYKFHKAGETNDDLINVCINEIDGLLQQLVDIATRINEIKATMRCPECGTSNDDEALYCNRCGAKLQREEPAESEEPQAPFREPMNEPMVTPMEAAAEVQATIILKEENIANPDAAAPIMEEAPHVEERVSEDEPEPESELQS